MEQKRTGVLRGGLAAIIALASFLGGGTGNALASWSLPNGDIHTKLDERPGQSNVVPGKILVKYKERPFARSLFRSMAAGADKPMELNVDPSRKMNDVLAELRNRSDVEYAEPVYLYGLLEGNATNLSSLAPSAAEPTPSGGGGSASPMAVPNDPELSNQWAVTVTGITYAWNRVPEKVRQNVKIAVIDSGVNADHPDLIGSVLPGYNAVDGSTDSSDNNGHGTMVAGIAAALTNNSLGIAGTAGGAKILPVRVGTYSPGGDYVIQSNALVEGIRWAVQNGARVINLSIGGGNYSQAVADAINDAMAKGVVVVAASGNESNHWLPGEPGNLNSQTGRTYASTSFPASLPGVIAVGAVSNTPDGRLLLSDFSNIGENLTAVAPGTDILTTEIYGDYDYGNGTSFSTPFVSGLAALLTAQNSKLSPDDVLRIVKESAKSKNESNQELITRPSYQGLPDEWLYIGGGLVDGKAALITPRLSIEAAQLTSLQGKPQFKVKVTALDDLGNKRGDLNGQIGLTTEYAQGAGGSVISMVYGIAETTVVADTTDDAYAVRFLADDGESFISSGYSLPFIKRPVPPAVNQASGTYTGPVTVSLSSSTPGASIIYTTNGSSPLTGAHATYTGPITLGESTTLKAAALKNGVASEQAVYTYTLNKVPVMGGGAPFIAAPVPETTVEGDTLYVKPDQEKLLEQLSSGSGSELHVNATTEQAVRKVEVELSGKVWSKAAAAGTNVNIEAGGLTLKIPANSFTYSGSDEPIRITAKMVTENISMPGYAQLISPVFELALFVGDRQISTFIEPVTVELKYDSLRITDPAKAGIYYYNEAVNKWEYVGGRLEQGIARGQLLHFSKYAVLEWNQTFEDIQGHWAQKSIERLASRQIVNGATDTSFAPDAEVTRAEFAALLGRSLRLSAGAAVLPFSDVAGDTWYHDPISKAYAAGLIDGIDPAHFAPEQTITREQMAVMLMRAQAFVSGGAPGTSNLELSIVQSISFKDRSAVGSWALGAVEQAASIGLIEGKPDGTFGPQERTTRAQAVTVLERLMDRFVKY